jgi:hypothetical protein
LAIDNTEKIIVADYKRKIRKIGDWISTAAENGLFDNDEGAFELITYLFRKANDCLEVTPPRTAECGEIIDNISRIYYKKIACKGRRWRAKNVYAFHILIYQILLLVPIFFFYYYDIDGDVSERLSIPQLAIDSAIWGMIGGILHGIWKLWQNVNKRSYRNAWLVYFISTPFLGGIFGSLTFFLVSAGLVIVSQGTSNAAISSGTAVNPLVVLVLAAFAGYNWEWAMVQLTRLAGSQSNSEKQG